MNYRKITASIAMLALLVTSTLAFGASVVAATFSDSANVSAWATNAVTKLANAGVISGRANGTFDPQGTLNRAEVAKIAVLSGKLTTDTTGAPHFNDVAPTDWFYPFVETLYNKGIVGGINNGALDSNGLATFNPAGTLNRAEAAKILVDAFNLEKAHAGNPPNFRDVAKNAWYFDYVETAYAHGLVTGYASGMFGPANAVTREQIAVIAQNSREEAGLADGSTQGGKRLTSYQTGLASSAISTNTNTTTTTPVTTTTAASDGTLAVALSASTPVATTVPAGASSIPVLAIDFTASADADVILTSLKLNKTGVSNDNNISNVYLYDGNNRLTSGRSITSTGSSVSFNNLGITIAKGSTKKITVKIDTASSATSGQSYGFKIADVTSVSSNAKSITGLFPISGNIFTASSTTGGSVTVSKSGSLVNPRVGEAGVTISKFQLTAGAAEDIAINQIGILISGTASASIVQNAHLYQSGTDIATVAGVNNQDLLVFVPATPFVITKGDSRTFEIKADLNTGRTSDTIDAYLDETTDILAIGQKFGFGVNVINSDLTSNAQKITLQGGDVTITANGPSANKVATNAKTVDLLDFNVISRNQVLFKKFAVKISMSANGGATEGLVDGSTPNLTNIKIINTKTNTTLMGPVDSNSFRQSSPATSNSLVADGADTTGYYAFTDELSLNSGDSLNLSLVADVRNLAALGTNSDAIVASIHITSTGSGDYPEIRDVNNKVVANSSSLVPSSTIDGKTMTVVANSLTLTRASTPVTKTYVKGTNGICFLGTNLKAGDGSEIKLTQLKVEGYIDTDASPGTFAAGSEADSGSSTRYVKDAISSVSLYDGTTQIGSIKSVQNDGTATFDNLTYLIPAGTTKTLRVCGNLSSSMDTTKITKLAFTISTATNVTAENKDGNSVSATVSAAVNGTTVPSVYMAMANVGTLLVKEEGSPNASILVAGSNGQTVSRYKFSAINESFIVKKLDLALDTNNDLTSATPETTYAASIVSGTISYKDKAGSTQTATAQFSGGIAQFSNLSLYIPADGNTMIDIKVDLNTISGGAVTGDLIKVGINENNSTANNSFEATADGSGMTVDAATGGIFTAAGSTVKTFVLRKTAPTIAKQVVATTLINGENTLYAFSVAADASSSVSLARTVFDLSVSDNNTGSEALSNFGLYRSSSKFSTGTNGQVNITASTISNAAEGAEISDSDMLGEVLATNDNALDHADPAGSYKVIVSFNQEETIPAGSSQTYYLKATASGMGAGDSVSTRIATGDEASPLSGLTTGANSNAQNTGKVYSTTATSALFSTAASDWANLTQAATNATITNFVWSDNASTSHTYPTVTSGVDPVSTIAGKAAAITTDTGSNDFTNGYLLKITELASQTLTY